MNMSSNKSFSLLILFSLLLSLIFDSAALTALKSCPSDCGGIEIPYPFGIGKGCYLEKWYKINCTSVSGKLVPFLSVVSKEVVKISLPGEFSWGSVPLSYGSVRIKNPITSKGCSSDDDDEEQESRSLLNLTGSPFYVGYSNTLIAIGCNNMASLTHVEPSMVGCISSCLATNRTTTSSKDYLALVDCNSKKNYEYCSQRGFKNETICNNGTGCCMANMPGSIQQVFGVRIATTGGGCKVAFLTDEAYSLLNETELINGTDPKQFHAKGYATVELGWFIHTTNPSFVKSLRCTTMKEYRSLYVKSYEKAHRINCSCDYNSYFPNHASCRCNKGYTGNSYLPGGCKDINECLEKDVDGNLWRCKGRKCVNLQGTYDCVHKNRRPLAATGVGSSFGSLIAAGGIYGLYKVISEGRRLRQKKKFFKRNGGLLLQQQLSSTEGNDETTRVFESSELEKATENFNSNRILGRQGTVYKGMLVDGRIVAAKKSKVVEENKLEEFINEVVSLSKINHRNIVKLLGCCLETDVPVLVNEFITNGNLFELLHDEFDDNTMATWEVRLRIAVDVAGALSYLHSSTPSPIYHRDVKSVNIMLDEKYRAKVSDFGILTVDHTDLTTVVSDTNGYMDPEYFQSNQYTDKSDVYSFGVVLAELITGEESISCLRSQENMKLATYFILAMKENRLSNIIDARIRDGCKLNQVIVVAKIARKCLNLKGKNRPSMREVLIELEKIRSSPGDMQPREYVGENEDERDEGVVDGNIGEGSRNKPIVTAPASQYIAAASSSSWFDV